VWQFKKGGIDAGLDQAGVPVGFNRGPWMGRMLKIKPAARAPSDDLDRNTGPA
jgi:hypothetical protein